APQLHEGGDPKPQLHQLPACPPQQQPPAYEVQPLMDLSPSPPAHSRLEDELRAEISDRRR
ncbi:GREB1-like protein, partial [Clarias magur]